MLFNLTIKPDDEYYKEAYNELISLTKYRKFQPIISIVLILIGSLLYFFLSKKYNWNISIYIHPYWII